VRSRAITDNLIDLLVETIHRINARAERRVEHELLEDLKRVSGKQSLLFQVADAALTHPDGIADIVFPIVSESTLRALVKEWRATGPSYRTTLRASIRNSYRWDRCRHGHRGSRGGKELRAVHRGDEASGHDFNVGYHGSGEFVSYRAWSGASAWLIKRFVGACVRVVGCAWNVICACCSREWSIRPSSRHTRLNSMTRAFEIMDAKLDGALKPLILF